MKPKIIGSILFLSFLLPGFILGIYWKPVPKYEKIINEISLRHYDMETYNCQNFSKELIKKLAEEGYEAYYIEGEVFSPEDNKFHGHAFVKLCVFVEATSGEILKPEDFEKNYIIYEK